jgi:hypothetical protein
MSQAICYTILLYISTREELSRCNDGLRAGRSGFDSWQRQDIFLFTLSTPTLESTQPPIPWVHGALSPEVKLPELEADHSPPSSAEVKNGGAVPSLPYTSLRNSD